MLPDTTVGGLGLPLAPGPAMGTIDDPVVLGLLSFGAFMIRWAVNERIKQIPGPVPDKVILDACPEANCFPFNPETTHVREDKPALFAWWEGKSQVSQWTTVYDVRRRDIKLLYLFAETVLPGGADVRHGLSGVVDAVFTRIGRDSSHPGYGFSGAPLGTPLILSLGLMQLQYSGGQQGMISEVPGNATIGEQGRGGGAIQRGYPFLAGTFTVWERVSGSTPQDPGDVALDFPVTLGTNESGDLDDTVDFFEGLLVGPDGSENLA
jgi:hypothetical protein